MSRKQIILDSCVWIAYFISSDSLHKRALSLANEIEKYEVIVPEYILLEVVSVLKAQKYHKEAREFAKRIMQTGALLVSDPDLPEKSLRKCFEKANSKLSFVDSALLVLSKKYEVISFDKALAKRLKKQHIA